MTDLDALSNSALKIAEAVQNKDVIAARRAKAELEQALRAALQKPALHEPVVLPSFRTVPVRVENYSHGYQEGYSCGWNDCLRYIKRAKSNTSGPACASKGEKT